MYLFQERAKVRIDVAETKKSNLHAWHRQSTQLAKHLNLLTKKSMIPTTAVLR